jgi:hypothetical protein
MKKYLPILVFLFMFKGVSGQRTIDILYLKDGSIIRGELVEKNDTVVRIRSCCDNIFAFRPDAVMKMEQIPVVKPMGSLSRKGYLNTISFGALIGTSDDDKSAPFSVIMEHNYRFHKYFMAGAYFGFEQLNENVLPLGISLKVTFPVRSCVFLLAGSGGYSVSLDKPSVEGIRKATGGYHAGAETGFIIPVSDHSALFLGIGYRYNELNYRLEDWWLGMYDRHITYNRFSLRFGITIY